MLARSLWKVVRKVVFVKCLDAAVKAVREVFLRTGPWRRDSFYESIHPLTPSVTVPV